MHEGGCSYMIDTAAVFFDYVRIEGWFYSEDDALVGVGLEGSKVEGIEGKVGLPHAGVVAALGENRGFLIEGILNASQRTGDLAVIFRTRNEKILKANVLELCLERKDQFGGRKLFEDFQEIVGQTRGTKLLDIGGRARSGVLRSQVFARADCTVFDILADEGVDVVGDAHVLSKYFAPNSFDAIFSVSVFEHLFMPWIVAREMGKVLRLGGCGYVSTHQTVGMHDAPWDFWRFSDTAWDAIFNRYSGFEILGRAVDNPQYITPHFWSPEQGEGMEKAAGFMGSSVLVRKISEPLPESETIDVASLVNTVYPDTVEKPPVWAPKPRKKFWWKF